MKTVFLLVAVTIAGAGVGAGAAWFAGNYLSGEPAMEDDEGDMSEHGPETDNASGYEHSVSRLPLATEIHVDAEYQRFDDEFLVPLVHNEAVVAMMILTLGLEVMPGQDDFVRSREPRLRNQLLQALFDHANSGGFDGMFTAGSNMRQLREGLTRAARDVVGDTIGSVLILDMVRQEA